MKPPVASIPANQIDLRIHDLERIEVLKGPQGTLYGEGSVGGTIRYITTDPDLNGFSGNLSVDGASSQDGEASYEVKSVLNMPLSDTLGLRLVGQVDNGGGWIDQPALSKSDINDYELYNFRAKLLWQPSDALQVKTTAIVHRNDAGAQNIGEDTNGDYRQSFDDPSTSFSVDDYDLFSVSIEYDLDNLRLISSTSYLDSDKKVANWGYQCCFATGTPGELWNVLVADFSASSEILSQEFRVASSEMSPWNWTLGLFYKDAKMIPVDIQGGLFGVPGGTLGVDLFAFSDFRDERSESWALFGETSFAMSDQLEVGVGLRYFEDDRQFRAGMTGAFQQDTFNSVNPKFYVSYSATENVRLYANVAKGFRSGGFNSAGRPPFDPEDVWSYELGSKFSSGDKSVSGELAVYLSDYQDYQIVGVVPELALNITSNAGAAEILGVDISLKWFPTEQLELGVNGNYMDTEFTEINVTSTSHDIGDPLDFVPQYGYTLWSSYSFQWSDSTPGFISIDYNKQGKSYARNRSLGSIHDEESDIIEMLNMRLGYEKDSWTIDLYAQNLLNERGLIGPFSNQLLSARPRPRTLGIHFGVNF